MPKVKAASQVVESDKKAASIPQPSQQPTGAAAPHPTNGKNATASAPGGGTGMQEREEMIRQAAYERYRQRGGRHGSAEQDWLQAEAAIDRPGPQTDEQRAKP